MNWEYILPRVPANTVPNAFFAGAYNLFVDSADGIAKKKDSAGTVTPIGSGSGGGTFPTTYSLNDVDFGDVDLDLSDGNYTIIQFDKVNLQSLILPENTETLYGIYLGVEFKTEQEFDFSTFTSLRYLLTDGSGTIKAIGLEEMDTLFVVSLSGLSNIDLDITNMISKTEIIISNSFDLETIDATGIETESFITEKDLPALETINITNAKLGAFEMEDNAALTTVTTTGAEVTNYNWHFSNPSPPVMTTVTFPTTTTEEITCTDAVNLDACTLTGAGEALTKVNFKSCSLNLASVDGILDFLNNAGLNNGTCDLSGGTNSAPTGGAANTDKVALEGRGWVVTVN